MQINKGENMKDCKHKKLYNNCLSCEIVIKQFSIIGIYYI